MRDKRGKRINTLQRAFFVFIVVFFILLLVLSVSNFILGKFGFFIDIQNALKGKGFVSQQAGGEPPILGPGDITAVLTASRITCVAPCSIFFDASGTTSASTSRPFHELDYSWNFGDPTSGTWAVSGESKNTAKGAVAAHVFENLGTYRVTLNVIDGSGGSDVEFVDVVIQNPNVVFSGTNTICFSRVGDFNGCPAGAQQIATTSFDSVMSYVAAGRRLLLRRGETWSTSSGYLINNLGPGIIGAFGTGAKPKIELTASNTLIRLSGCTSPQLEDWRFMDLEIYGLGTVIPAPKTFLNGGMSKKLLFLRIDAHDIEAHVTMDHSPGNYCNDQICTGDPSCLGPHRSHDEIAIVENTVYNIYGGNAVYLGTERSMVMGNTLSVNPENTIASEHVLRTPMIDKGVIQHNDIRGEGGAVRHVLKLHGPDPALDDGYQWGIGLETGRRTQYAVVSDNVFESRIGAGNVVISPSDSESNEAIAEVVFERNHMLTTSPALWQMLWINARNVTVRNNVFDLSGGIQGGGIKTAMSINTRGIEPPPMDVHVYENTAYNPDVNSFYFVFLTDGTDTGTIVRNNLIYSPQSAPNGWTVLAVGGGGASVGLVQSNNVDASAQAASNIFVNPVLNNPNDFALVDNAYTRANLIDRGFAVPVFDDYNRNARPSGIGFDMGAYEFGAAPPGPQCSNGVDDDLDGLVDWQFDLGCWGSDDATEGGLVSGSLDNGWTVFEPSADTRLVLVTNNLGVEETNACNRFIAGFPSRSCFVETTLAAANSRLRDGSPDWMLLKRGDEWAGQSINPTLSANGGGKSYDERRIIGSYGNSIQRPIIKNSGFYVDAFLPTAQMNNLVIIGIEFYASYRDPSNLADYNAGSSSDRGITLFGPSNNILIEDNKLSFYRTNIGISEDSRSTLPYPQRVNITIRRNIISDSWGDGPAELHSQGSFLALITNLLFEENIYYHNGWNEQIAVAVPTIYNHNVYFKEIVNLTERGNLLIKGSSFGSKHSADAPDSFIDALIENNAYIENGNTMSFDHSSGPSGGSGTYTHRGMTLRNNVMSRTGRFLYDYRGAGGQGNQAFGVWFRNVNTALVENNRFIDKPFSSGITFLVQTHFENVHRDVTIRNNTAYQWFNPTIEMNNVVNPVVENNDIDLPASTYVDASRTIVSYDSLIGGTGSIASFAQGAKQQSKYNWRTQYTADAFNDYVREGFTKIQLSECNDGVDNDNDGLVDWQYDLGCWGSGDTTEGGLPSGSLDNGWTVFEPTRGSANPADDTQIVYVSSTDGNDAWSGLCPVFDGVSCGPRRTIGAGVSLLRNGYPDWMLLKRGNVWYESLSSDIGSWSRSGKSDSERMVIASYGSSTAPPLLKTGTSPGISIWGYDNLGIVGLDFYAHTRDPTSTEFSDLAGRQGINIQYHAQNITIEGNRIRYYISGLDVLGITDENGVKPHGKVDIRRNIIANSYSTISHAQGIFTGGSSDRTDIGSGWITIEENILYHDGWSSDFPPHHIVTDPGTTDPTAWRAIRDGRFNIGIGSTIYNIANVDFSSATSMDDVAVALQNAINGVVGVNAVNVSWWRNAVLIFLGNSDRVNFIEPYSGAVAGTDIHGSTWMNAINAHGAEATIYNRNMYLAYGFGRTIVRGNIDASGASGGMQVRMGGISENNLMLRDPLGITMGHTQNPPNSIVSGVIRNNVILDNRDIEGSNGGYAIAAGGKNDPGFGLVTLDSLNISGNIISTNTQNINVVSALALGDPIGSVPGPTNNVRVIDNIVYNWRGTSGATGVAFRYYGPFANNILIENNTFQQTQGGRIAEIGDASVIPELTFRNNVYYSSSGQTTWFNIGGTNYDLVGWNAQTGETGAQARQVSFVDPSRNVETYMASLGETSATYNGFISRAISMSKHNWDERFTAPVVNDYVRAGFAVVAAPDSTPPSVPAGLSATPISPVQINLAWTASTDVETGILRYNVYRDGVLVASPMGTTYSDTGLTPLTSYSYGVSAVNGANLESARSVSVSASTPADITAPSVSITSPSAGDVSGIVTISALATDNVGVVGVQFLLDGVNFGAEDLSAPYGVSWDTSALVGTSHTISAVARDAAANTQTSAGVSVNVVAALTCFTSSSTWTNNAFAVQSGVFTAEFDVTPNAADMNGVTGISFGAGTAFSNFSVLFGFNASNDINACNGVCAGGAYQAVNRVVYTAGTQYHFRAIIDIPNRIYDANVTLPNGTEILLADDYAFRSDSPAVTQLNNWGIWALTGTHSVCNFQITSAPAPSCVLTGASWNTASAVEGDPLTLSVTGNNCDGQAVSFVVRENDMFNGEDIFDDNVLVNPANAVFSSGAATTTWTAEYQADAFGDPEFYFIAALVSNPAVSLQSGDVSVSQIVVPSVTIVSPSAGAVLGSSEVDVDFAVSNWVVGGKGSNHIHFHLDNVPGYTFGNHFMFYNGVENRVEFETIDGPTPFATWIDSDTIRFHNVPNGAHNLRVHLADPSHNVLVGNSEADKTIGFSVSLSCFDNDLDGYNVTGGSCGVVDCNDANDAVYPGATEVCDGVDNNCLSGVDELGSLLCTDGNDQTIDSCVAGVCTYEDALCPTADVNGDGGVNVLDLAEVIVNNRDVNGDSVVNIQDLIFVARRLNTC